MIAGTKLYFLQSVSIWRKYLIFLDIPFSILLSRHMFLTPPWNMWKSQVSVITQESNHNLESWVPSCNQSWFRTLHAIINSSRWCFMSFLFLSQSAWFCCAKLLWCNARLQAFWFYNHLDFQIVNLISYLTINHTYDTDSLQGSTFQQQICPSIFHSSQS